MKSGEWVAASLPAMLLCAALGSTSAQGQTDLAGTWGHQGIEYQDFGLRSPGPEPVDYTGLPIDGQARTVALSYSAEQIARPETECNSFGYTHLPDYILDGPGMFTMWPDYDPQTGSVVAWNLSGEIHLKIWMDGRSHPSQYADHTTSGFTTGVWQGDILTTYTTHMQPGYLRRNGVPVSDRTTMTLHFIRHGDLLTVSGEIDDPVYMTRSLILSRVLGFDPTGESSILQRTCQPTVEVAQYANVGTVPNYLPGDNPSTNDLTALYHIPHFAAMGGAETMYPEFRKRLQRVYIAPAKCEKYCCGWDNWGGAADTLPACPTFFIIRRPMPYIPPAPFTP